MIILQIQVFYTTVFFSESYSPVAGHRNAPSAPTRSRRYRRKSGERSIICLELRPNLVYGRMWTAPLMQACCLNGSGSVVRCSRMSVHGRAQKCKRFLRTVRCNAVRLSRASGLSFAAFHLPRARMEMRRSGPNRPRELESSRTYPGFPDPVSMTVCPYLVLRPAHIAPGVIRSPAAQATGTGSW